MTLFAGLAYWEWHGVLAFVLLGVFAVEIVLTLWDFVVEDRTRLLPATERVTHTVLAINGGAFITLLALNVADWAASPTAWCMEPSRLAESLPRPVRHRRRPVGTARCLAALRLGRTASMRAAMPPPIAFDGVKRTVLVTGATGFVGQNLVRALLRDGHR
jgi:hypothetical protein